MWGGEGARTSIGSKGSGGPFHGSKGSAGERDTSSDSRSSGFQVLLKAIPLVPGALRGLPEGWGKSAIQLEIDKVKSL
jgi:hypothetical protein